MTMLARRSRVNAVRRNGSLATRSAPEFAAPVSVEELRTGRGVAELRGADMLAGLRPLLRPSVPIWFAVETRLKHGALGAVGRIDSADRRHDPGS